MKRLLIVAIILSCRVGDIAGQAGTATPAETVVISSDALKLKALVWRPAGTGPFPAVLFNHGSGPTDPARAQRIGPVFARHGYLFVFLFRRGDGLSSDQGQFIFDALDAAARTGGEQARDRLMNGQLTQEHLGDVLAGLAFLKTTPGVDTRRVAIAGHSFGGQLTLLAAARDATLRAAVTFAAAAQRWDGSQELRETLVTAARNIQAPVLLMHAANDYSTQPARVMAAERARAHKTFEMKIYPAVGTTAAEGHGAVYTDVAAWEGDVFRFLDEHVKRSQR